MMRWKVKGVVLTQQFIVFIVLVFFNIISSIVIILLYLNVNKLNTNYYACSKILTNLLSNATTVTKSADSVF